MVRLTEKKLAGVVPSVEALEIFQVFRQHWGVVAVARPAVRFAWFVDGRSISFSTLSIHINGPA